MKFPKHRADLFLVERTVEYMEDEFKTIVIGGFPTSEAADAYKEACEQDMIDKGFGSLLDNGIFEFNVTLTTYYDA